jgi:hypothetical protein
MHPAFAKSFGGLSRAYYFRQLFFGSLFPLLVVVMSTAGSRPVNLPWSAYVVFAINTLLYPYSRFVYEGVVGFIVGGNLFVVNAFSMLFVKVLTMLLCWGMAIFIAPIGLLYLYIHHSRANA